MKIGLVAELFRNGDMMGEVARTGDWNDDIEARFKAMVESFKASHSW